MSRQEMIATLDERMVRTSDHFRETGRRQYKRNPLKSFLVEANVPGVAEDRDAVSNFLTSDGIDIPVRVVKTDDISIHRLFVGKDDTEFWLDTLDDRFWILHTVESATEADYVIRRLVNNSRKLDSIWLPSGFFEQTIDILGLPRQLTSKFSVRTGLYQESIPEDLAADALVMKMGGSVDRWREFRSTPELSRTMALWSARIVRRNEDTDLSADDDITASGKVTARGDSFNIHQELLTVLKNQYAGLIKGWERTFHLDWATDHDGLKPSGKTAVIPFTNRLGEEPLVGLVEALFEGGEPYRLFGSPIRQGPNRIVTRAVDLHTGGRINFEITDSFIRVYLFPQTCGNVLARLVTNLQHFHDARITLEPVA
jgi:hypothetical protein